MPKAVEDNLTPSSFAHRVAEDRSSFAGLCPQTLAINLKATEESRLAASPIRPLAASPVPSSRGPWSVAGTVALGPLGDERLTGHKIFHSPIFSDNCIRLN